MRPALSLLAAFLACICLPAAARAAPSVKLHATLTPERLGQSTTVGFGFQITAPAGQIPPPLTEVDVSYPNNLGIALSGLGMADCTQAALEAAGLEGCPANSQMGYGTATADVLGPEITETASVTVVRAPLQDGNIALFFYTDAMTPVDAQLVFPGLLLSAPTPFGGRINIKVPLVPSLPGSPYVSVVKLQATLGPQNLTYYESVRGRIVAYKPKGIVLPNSCPHGGFPFATELGFQDGSRASAKTTVPCPARKRRHRAAPHRRASPISRT